MRKETESRTDIFMSLYTYMTVYVQVCSANLKKKKKDVIELEMIQKRLTKLIRDLE